MNEEELNKLLKDPQRILNLAREFHHLLHQLEKMEEEKLKVKPEEFMLTIKSRETSILENFIIICRFDKSD